MAGAETLLGLDIGTTKVAAVIGGRGPQVRLLGAASVPCSGLRRGIVADVPETTEAVREAVTKAQRMAGVELEAAWVGITGQHIGSLNSRAQIQLPRGKRQVSWAEVERVMAAAVNAVSISPGRQMIHAISRGFTVDDEPRVRNPVGLSAGRLAVETHVITASRNLVENVTKCVEQAGIGVAELVAEPLAAADAVLTDDEEELGVVLVDVGGGTTDLALFLGGSIAFTGAAPVAGNNVTHDLAVALGVTYPTAEQVKLAHGCARAALVPEDEMITLPGEEEERAVSRRFVAEVIEARVEETFRLVAQEMSSVGDRWPPPGGAVLTGGGSLLPSIAGVARDTLGCRTRLGRPRVAAGPMELLESPALATGVGLVYYAQREGESRHAEPRRGFRLLPALGRVISWGESGVSAGDRADGRRHRRPCVSGACGGGCGAGAKAWGATAVRRWRSGRGQTGSGGRDSLPRDIGSWAGGPRRVGLAAAAPVAQRTGSVSASAAEPSGATTVWPCGGDRDWRLCFGTCAAGGTAASHTLRGTGGESNSGVDQPDRCENGGCDGGGAS